MKTKKIKKSKEQGGPSLFESGSNIPIDKVTGVEGSPSHEASESAAVEKAEPPSEHELDMHYETMMKAQKIKKDPHIMKHLGPHMDKKMEHMQSMMGEHSAKPITSIQGLKDKYKKMK